MMFQVPATVKVGPWEMTGALQADFFSNVIH
jgi:hypothetical protein